MDQDTRALSVIRLSSLNDDTTSPERQRTHNQGVADRHGLTIVGEAEDLDISASKFPPLERPQLGDWLRNRSDEFDVIIFWRLDRFVRSVADFSVMLEWCNKRGKNLVSATEAFELQDPSGFGRAMAQIISVFAELETNTLQSRVQDGHRKLRSEGRWPGGPAPYGYVSAPRNGGGRCLIPDPETSAYVREAADQVLSGESLLSVARSFNQRGIPTNLDRLATQAGRDPSGHEWEQGGIGRILRNPATMGIQTTGRTWKAQRVVRDDNGYPRRVAEPLLDQDTWDRVQAVLADRSVTKSRTNTTALLLGVVACGRCGQNMYQKQKTSQNGTSHRYYVCTGKRRQGRNCDVGYFIADDVETFTEERFLNADMSDGRHLHEHEVTHRVFVPGENHDNQLAEIERAIEELMSDRRAGLYGSSAGVNEFRKQMANLEADYERLSALPSQPDEYRRESTGETYGQLWARLDSDGRRDLLKAVGIRVTLHRPKPSEMEIYVPGELELRAHEWTSQDAS